MLANQSSAPIVQWRESMLLKWLSPKNMNTKDAPTQSPVRPGLGRPLPVQMFGCIAITRSV